MTDTSSGSSGSPAFNRFWQVIALHHSGVPKKDAQGRVLTKDGKIWDSSMDETSIDWIANEGVRISAIVADLKVTVGSHPLVKPVLDEVQPPLPATEKASVPADASPYGNGNGHDLWFEQSGGVTSLVVPVRIPVPMFRKNGQIVPEATQTSRSRRRLPARSAARASACLRVCRWRPCISTISTLGSRPGYKPNFIGTGKFSVPSAKNSGLAQIQGRHAEIRFPRNPN